MADEMAGLINELLGADNASLDEKDIQVILSSQDAAEVALLLESLPLDQRVSIWNEVAFSERLDVLVEMRSDPRESILDTMSREQMDELLTDLEAETLIELSESLPNRLVDRAFAKMDEKQQTWFRRAQEYKDCQAGRWLTHDVLMLPQNAKVKDALRLLRRDFGYYTDAIFLTNRTGKFSGAVSISSVIGKPEHLPLVALLEEDYVTIRGDEDAVDASLKVQKSGFSSLPVVSDIDELLGRLDIGSASKVVNEYYEGQLMANAGMSEDEDLFSPVRKSAEGRAVWLGINLLTAFAASWFIGLFEATLEQVVALAVLMPVVASMGGIAGSQTLTLMIRGLALGQITSGNMGALLKKEIQVGGLNGIIWAIVVGIIASIWFNTPAIGFVIGVAILVNIIAAAFSGVLIPVLLDKLKIDPALSGSVILTTVTDIIGFVAFLGLGTLILL